MGYIKYNKTTKIRSQQQIFAIHQYVCMYGHI